MKVKRFLSATLAMLLVVYMSVPAHAASTGYSIVTLTTAGGDGDVISVSVPAEIPLSMDSDGNITTPNNLKIINTSVSDSVEVIAIQAEALNGWSMDDFSADFSSKADDTKEFSFSLNGDEMDYTGDFDLTTGNWSIAADSYLALDVEAKIPMQTEASSSQISKIGFTIQLIDSSDIICPECEQEVSSSAEHKLDCGHYSCDGLDHDDAACELDGHYNCDGLDHENCDICGEANCVGEHGEGVCGVAGIATLSVDYENGLMLPGSTNSATFNWTTNIEDNTLVSVTSSNPDIAEAQSVMSLAVGEEVTGEQNVAVTAKARGTTTITGTLSSGETASFVVEVSELQSETGGAEPSGEVEGADELVAGDTLSPEDITVTIPVTNPDGTKTTIEVTPETIEETDLVEGENEIEVSVDVNGTTINVTIIINIASSNPANGLINTVAEAQAAGWTFESWEEGLQITGFTNVNLSTDIIVPEQIGSFKVLSIGDSVFEGESNLKKIILPDTVYNIGEKAFYGCSGLDELRCPSNVDYIGNSAFGYCGGTIYIGGDGLARDRYNGGGNFIGATGHVVVAEGTTILGKYSFCKFEGSELTLPVSLTDIGTGTLTGTFNTLRIVNYNGTKNQWLKIYDSINIGNNFYYIEMNYLGLGATMDGASVSANGVVTFTPDVTSIPDYAFECNTKIKSLVIPDEIETIGSYAFSGCSNLQSLTIPSTISEIGARAFEKCTSLKDLIIENGVTTIGVWVFSNCTSITTVEIPDSLTIINGAMFYGCTSLETVIVPDTITSFGNQAFRNCENLKSIYIPSDVTYIGNYTFGDCTSLETINYAGTEEQWNAITFGTDWNLNTGSATEAGTYTVVYNYTE